MDPTSQIGNSAETFLESFSFGFCCSKFVLLFLTEPDLYVQWMLTPVNDSVNGYAIGATTKRKDADATLTNL